MKTKNLLKKAFLLLALMGGASSAWADPVFGEANSICIDISQYATIPTVDGYSSYMDNLIGYDSEDNILVVNAYGAINSKGSQKWITVDGSGSATRDAWAATGVFKGTSYYGYLEAGMSGSKYRVNALNNSRTTIFEITNCTKVSALVKSGGTGSGRYVVMKAYLMNAEGTEKASDTPVSTQNGTNSNVMESIVIDGLNAANVYKIELTGNGSDNSDFYEIAFYTPSSNPTITVSPTSTSIETTESGVEATENITVTGANLTGSTLTATLSPAVDGLSVTLGSNTITDGAISTTATLHYTQIENASGSTTLTLSDGTTSKEITVNYTASVETWTLQTINSARTWDFSTLTGGKLYEGDDVNVEHVYANITEIGCPAAFDGTALAFTGQYPLREGKGIAQAGTLRFNTSVPGYIVVKFSDTGTSASATAVKRYLTVNGETTEYWASRANNSSDPEIAYDAQLNVITGAIAVPAGDVTIGGTSALVYQKVEFTPTVSKTITDAGWATYCSPYALDLEHATGLTDAYIVTGATGNVLNTTSVKGGTIPANTGILIEAPKGTVTIPVVANSSTDVSDNKFVGVTTETSGVAAGIYVLMGTPSVGFYETTNPFTVGANTAYLPADFAAGAARSAYFIGGVTAVDNVEAAAKVKAMPVKRIVNGKLIIEKKGAIFNAAGQKLSK